MILQIVGEDVHRLCRRINPQAGIVLSKDVDHLIAPHLHHLMEQRMKHPLLIAVEVRLVCHDLVQTGELIFAWINAKR
ncbi:hypothetical protein D3C76_1222090 [compost metagenome]